VLVICAMTGRWWVAAVGVPLSLVAAGRRVEAQVTPLRADATGITLDGRWTGWADVEAVTVSPGSVRVQLGAHAELPPWARGRITRPVDRPGVPDDSVQLTAVVRGEERGLLEGIRAQAPAAVRVEAGRWHQDWDDKSESPN
jgi:hypothetical protein